jgi:hypothetical protein
MVRILNIHIKKKKIYKKKKLILVFLFKGLTDLK